SEEEYDEQSINELHHIFASAGALGITVCAGTGDFGSGGGQRDDFDGEVHVTYPASDDLALACGGTQIVAGSDGVLNDGKPRDEEAGVVGGGGRTQPVLQGPAVPGSCRTAGVARDGEAGPRDTGPRDERRRELLRAR